MAKKATKGEEPKEIEKTKEKNFLKAYAETLSKLSFAEKQFKAFNQFAMVADLMTPFWIAGIILYFIVVAIAQIGIAVSTANTSSIAGLNAGVIGVVIGIWFFLDICKKMMNINHRGENQILDSFVTIYTYVGGIVIMLLYTLRFNYPSMLSMMCAVALFASISFFFSILFRAMSVLVLLWQLDVKGLRRYIFHSEVSEKK